MSGTFTSPTVYGVRAEMIGNASRAIDDRSLAPTRSTCRREFTSRFHQHGGLWFGGGVARPWRVAVFSAADVTDAGAWGKLGSPTAKFGTATLTATFTNFSFSKIASVHDTGKRGTVLREHSSSALADRGPMRGWFTESSTGTACERQSRFGDLEGSLHWEVGAFELTAQTGRRFGDSYDVTADSRRWTAGDRHDLAQRSHRDCRRRRTPTGASAPRPPGSIVRNGRARARVLADVQDVGACVPSARDARQEFRDATAAPGMHKIIIHVRGVETVDVMGDFSDWSPLMLQRRGRDLWELSVPLSPGMHQINVRVDRGPWMAPPGMPTMRDSFGGEVGLISVNPDKATH